MNIWKILNIALFILILSSFSANAAQISEYEASKITSSYTYDGELCEAYGPYEYNNNMYYVCTISEGDNVKAEIVIDANSGDLVTSEPVAKYLIKHDLALYYLFDEESYSLNMQNADVYRQDVVSLEEDYNFWIDLRDIANTQEQKQNAKEAADISLDMKTICENKVEVIEEIIDIQTRIKSGGTLKDAEKIIEAEEKAYYIEKQALPKINNAIERTPIIYSTILNNNYKYGISDSEWNIYKSDDVSFLEYEKDVTQSNIAYWESMENMLESDTQWHYEAMLDRIGATESSNTTPSFTLGLSMLALLIVGMFFRTKQG
ncbi:hypothetical protein LI82_06715 [Methanococcoides methylutens]|uniref:Uncharacterized protein n=1 Tax=Methanococcoides methylutens TaxID=2226 RepID=A0A099T310_METMT|nr:hypothetical protein [Methanococcoides methylutens]KGK98563.1 hypothetical protein LI82_06715 [Methanococcoides methylutens]